MRRGLRPVADPQPWHRTAHRQIERVGRGPARQMLGCGRGIGIERVPLALGNVGQAEQFTEQHPERCLFTVKVEPFELIAAVEEPTAELWPANQHLHRLATIA